MRPMRLHIAGKVEDGVQRCVVCGEVLYDANSTKVEPGMRVAEAITGESEGRHLESMTPEDSLPLGIYACKPARI